MTETLKEVWIGYGKIHAVPVHGTTSYTLTTHALAMAAAVCEGLVNEAAGMADDEGEAAFVEGRMRACIPADAQAALDALLQAERVKALKEAAGMLRDKHCNYMTSKGRNPANYASQYSLAENELYALIYTPPAEKIPDDD